MKRGSLKPTAVIAALALSVTAWFSLAGLLHGEDLAESRMVDQTQFLSGGVPSWAVADETFAQDPTENNANESLPTPADEPPLFSEEEKEDIALPGGLFSSVVTEHPDDNPGFDLSWYQPHECHAEHVPLRWKLWEHLVELVDKPHEPLVHLSERLVHGKHDGTSFTDAHDSWVNPYPIGIQPIVDRPSLVLGEFGERYLGEGTIQPGLQSRTGAVWRPALFIFGSNRLGVSYRNDRFAPGAGAGAPAAQGRKFGSVVNRLDLFGQLKLSGTEHAVLGLRPTDQEVGSRPGLTGREFSSYFWRESTVPGGPSFSKLSGSNLDIQTAFFEGQFDEIFPFLDPYDTRFLDYGFSIGRQPMSFQRGLLMNEDMIDAVTVTRNTVFGPRNLNLRMTGVFAWNRATRITPALGPGGETTGPNTNAKMYGLFTESDFYKATVNLDAAFIDDPDPAHGDLLVFGASSTQRFIGFHNTYNTRFHVLASFPTDGRLNSSIIRPQGTVSHVSGQGELFFSQVSWTPHESEDLIYWNTFVAVDEFTSLPRAPQAGALGDTGLLFAGAGLGLYGSPLATVSTSAVGTALGYQMFFDTKAKQLVWELGIRNGKDADDLEGAAGFQYQQAFKQRWIWLVSGFLSGRQNTSGLSQGIRTELQLMF